LIRPLINTKKSELIYISQKVFKFYLTDPSNFREKFLRTRIRNYLDKFKLDGLDVNKIKLTLNNLQSANESINYYKEKSIKNYVRYLQHNTCFVSYGLFNYESEEVIFRTISDIICKISGSYYPPRGKDIKNLITRIQSIKYKKSTLGGCIIEKTYNILIFRKEFGVQS
jgi:tRNA(Ile)-lysidine synthase